MRQHYSARQSEENHGSNSTSQGGQVNPRRASSLSYEAVGVDASHEEANLGGLGKWVTKTFEHNASKPLLPLGFYANVLPLSDDLGLAISTDGVGTKILI